MNVKRRPRSRRRNPFEEIARLEVPLRERAELLER